MSQNKTNCSGKIRRGREREKVTMSEIVEFSHRTRQRTSGLLLAASK
jgi:hypothetical protein